MLAEGRLEPHQAKKIFSKARNKKALKKAKLTKAPDPGLANGASRDPAELWAHPPRGAPD
jgi:hypothetical protein